MYLNLKMLLILLGVIIILIIVSVKRGVCGVTGIKLILLGINITLFCGIIAIDPNSDLGGIEYLIGLIGLVISIVGVAKKDNV